MCVNILTTVVLIYMANMHVKLDWLQNFLSDCLDPFDVSFSIHFMVMNFDELSCSFLVIFAMLL